MISHVIFDVSAHVTGQSLAGKKNIIRPVAGGICLGQDLPAGTIPIVDSTGLLNPASIRVVSVGDASGAGDAILSVKDKTAAQAIVGHISCGIIGQTAQVIVGIGGLVHVLARRAARSLVGEIAPRVKGVSVGPMAIVAGGEQPIQRVVGESLGAGGIFHIGDGENVSVIAAGGSVRILFVEERS